MMSFHFDNIISQSLGHFVFEHLRLQQDRVYQIDAATGEEETYASVLKRSIHLANALRAFGLSPGDVLAVSGPNHLDICIPYYAAFFNGQPIIGVDHYYKYDEVRSLFHITSPKIAFCQRAYYDTYAKAAADLDLDLKLITFDEGDCTMEKFVQMYGKNEPEDDFKVAEFDTEKIYALLNCTSGTTGTLKVAAFTHSTLVLKNTWLMKRMLASQRYKKTLVLSPINWATSICLLIYAPIAGYTKVQTSKSGDLDHYIDIINKYRPETCFTGPPLAAYLISRKNDVDLTCFHYIGIVRKLFRETYMELKKLVDKNCNVFQVYGQTECFGLTLSFNPFGPFGSCGKPSKLYSIKLVDRDTAAEIHEANVTGELLVKGPVLSEYYNDPEKTARVFTEDGFFKTGDLFYRDDDDNYFFVERISRLIKFRNINVLPAELEEVIMGHPGVKQVCVVGVDDPVDGQRPVACVVRHEGCDVSAQEIKDLVASKLCKTKELRGGVVFLDTMPLSSAGNIAVANVKEIAMRVEKE